METLIKPENEVLPNRLRFTRTMRKFLIDNGLLDARSELIDGVIILKMPINPPSPGRFNAVCVDWLLSLCVRTAVCSRNPKILLRNSR